MLSRSPRTERRQKRSCRSFCTLRLTVKSANSFAFSSCGAPFRIAQPSRHAARPVCRVDHHKLVARGDAAAGRLFERHADDGLPARDGGQDRAGALQLLPIKIFGKGLQNFIRFARKRAEHRDERRIARAGDRRVGKGDLSRQAPAGADRPSR